MAGNSKHRMFPDRRIFVTFFRMCFPWFSHPHLNLYLYVLWYISTCQSQFCIPEQKETRGWNSKISSFGKEIYSAFDVTDRTSCLHNTTFP